MPRPWPGSPIGVGEDEMGWVPGFPGTTGLGLSGLFSKRVSKKSSETVRGELVEP